MRLNLVNGKLVTPTSTPAARQRLHQLEYEISKTEIQLGDLSRITKYAKLSDYETWERSAKAVIRHMRKEADQLTEWLAREVEKESAKFWAED